MALFLPQIDYLFGIVSKYANHEQEQTAQTALFTIKLLAKRLAEKHPAEFSTVSVTSRRFTSPMFVVLDIYLVIDIYLSTTTTGGQWPALEFQCQYLSLSRWTMRNTEGVFCLWTANVYAACHPNLSIRACDQVIFYPSWSLWKHSTHTVSLVCLDMNYCSPVSSLVCRN